MKFTGLSQPGDLLRALKVHVQGFIVKDAPAQTLTDGIRRVWTPRLSWRKGATSGDTLALVDIRVNCEQNSLLYVVRRTTGGACHTQSPSGAPRPTCYYRNIVDEASLEHIR
ncbi:phosphoribosyl-AMP cyclohydrolase [Actinoallomurus iriomotensis]|uniref:phosphoribosyl-AMP cyclohydrolase n=1 Tax=Actinoallomurus iriomotensis TaxID=478107 RepID=A0A9W6VRI0_9ACTN|nr:phosphoribosyl-AMP cyclohydrolase [Actinoallomurus iriomotensis]GLY76537.1 hypothetical protein Airi01_048040 [Actinoallomurus iriomotensis]